jgi:hypothetical protein
MKPGACSVSALVGPGRSGTTWAGTLIDSSPDVIYRFEPFHRMTASSADYRHWMERLKAHQVRATDVPRLHSLLSRAHALTSKEPFFTKSYRQRTFGRRQLWPAARLLPPAAWAYERLYSPSVEAPIVFKEVTFVKQLQNLLLYTTVPVVYLVRHPCATVLSEVHGQADGKMPSGRQQRLAEVLQDHAPELAERFGDVCRGSDVVLRTALLWRCEIETCLRAIEGSSHGLVMTYEQLADDVHTHTRTMFRHFGLAFRDQTIRFIDALCALDPASRDSPRKTGWGNRYYSVYRNPREQKDAWKARISSTDRRKIESIVEDSAAVSQCASLGGWT